MYINNIHIISNETGPPVVKIGENILFLFVVKL